jgi:mono/diheme cytochrome c family protein
MNRPAALGWRRWAGALLALLAALSLWAMWRGDWSPAATDTPAGGTEAVERGSRLALAGNCATCHTARGGPPYAGGRGIATPFGTVFAGNLTPDDETGIGRWTNADFWRALHHGRSRDGHRLIPAFPYPSFTQVTREDADALHAYLRSLAPVHQANRPHALRWPYGSPVALAVWRALYFRPAPETVTSSIDPSRSAEWNRGAYLVRGLGHCQACHGRRDVLGGLSDAAALEGGRLPQQGWYAPSLADPAEAGVMQWPADEVLSLLRTGTSTRGVAQGPMAEVVVRSTQHLPETDLRAIVAYLQSLPAPPPAPPPAPRPKAASEAEAGPIRDRSAMVRGEKLYADHCRSCHGDQGQGAPGIYPALAGSRMVTMTDPTNLLRVITQGGFAPATSDNPRPYGMPPFDLPDADLAALTTWLRASWGHDADPVTAAQAITTR